MLEAGRLLGTAQRAARAAGRTGAAGRAADARAAAGYIRRGDRALADWRLRSSAVAEVAGVVVNHTTTALALLAGVALAAVDGGAVRVLGASPAAARNLRLGHRRRGRHDAGDERYRRHGCADPSRLLRQFAPRDTLLMEHKRRPLEQRALLELCDRRTDLVVRDRTPEPYARRLGDGGVLRAAVALLEHRSSERAQAVDVLALEVVDDNLVAHLLCQKPIGTRLGRSISGPTHGVTPCSR